jgi:signal transduction histidine kinase/ActR/RegA family two-component response regulator
VDDQQTVAGSELSELARLHRFSTRLASSLEMPLVLEELLRAAVDVVHADAGVLSLCTDGGRWLELAVSCGFPEKVIDSLRRVPCGKGACGYALKVGRQTSVEDVENHPLFAEYREVARNAGFRAVHSTPLTTRGGEIIGVISTHFKQPHKPTDDEIRLMGLYVRQAEDCIENARLYKRAQEEISWRSRAEEALQRTELQFYRMMNNLPAAAYTCNAEGLITYFNPQAVVLWGRTPRLNDESDRYCGCYKAFRSDGSPISNTESWTARALETRSEYIGEEVIIERPDGSRITALSHASPIIEPTGKLIGAVNILVDISERKRIEDALQKADRRKDEFLATLAHELRNPLAPLKTSLELLRRHGGEDPVVSEAHNVMERQVSQLVRLVDDLMQVSRITRGKVELKREYCDVRQIVMTAVETSKPTIEAAKHSLETILPDEPVILYADPLRLGQVISNLLNNAAKYTDAGGQIVLAVHIVNSRVEIRVRDNGVGIPRDMLSHVFEMFAQVDRTLRRSQGGLGIGLTLARTLIQLHGGTIEARSEGVGRGSEFVVSLPLAKSKTEDAPLKHARPPGHSGPEIGGAKQAAASRRILVVDDNRDAAQSLGLLLQSLGNDVRIAHSGVDAIITARAYHPAVVLLDIGMPGMDGYEAARKLREDPHLGGIILIALTGWGQDEDRQRSREAGFNHHLVKPIDIEVLEKILSELSGNGAQEYLKAV